MQFQNICGFILRTIIANYRKKALYKGVHNEIISKHSQKVRTESASMKCKANNLFRYYIWQM